MPVLGATGTIMQWIENQGYLASFLIQDGLGMTAPRVWTGFHRDKELTGKYNIQEGFEVLGREGLTGPFIIGVAPAVLALTGLFCKSTNTNTRLIKRFGESLKEMISQPDFDKLIQKDRDKFKKEFFKYNIEAIYKNTIPNDKNSEETIKYLLDEFDRFDTKNKKQRNEALAKMKDKINDKLLETSSDLYNVNKLYVGNENSRKAFGLAETLTALKNYGNDAIFNNKNFENIDQVSAENIKNNFASKRLFTNIANIAITLTGLAFLPKLYARSNVSPGARALEHSKQQKAKENPSFKGKGINNDGFFAKLGKMITKYTPEKIQELMEYSGYNFTKTTFACLSTFGLLLPRGKRAWDRAQIDENGKRDMTEIHEILLRDTVSSLSVVFAVPLLTKMLVKSYENKVGFVLTNRASDGKSNFKKALDIINPYSDLEVLSVADLDSIYGNIDSKQKLMNFTDFVSSKGGDLEKILAKSEHASLIFNDNTFTLDSIKHLSKEEKNKKIKALFEKLDSSNDVISKVMKGTGTVKNNPIAKMARGLNSLPGFVSTVILSPLLLGVFIPMLTYHNTRKANEKKLSAPKKTA